MRACAFVCVFVCAYVCEYVLACVRVCVFVCVRAYASELCFCDQNMSTLQTHFSTNCGPIC